MSLLDKAKLVEVRKTSANKNITDEQVELVIAWAQGEITTTQAASALGIKQYNFDYIAKNTLVQAIRDKRLVSNMI